MFFACFLHIFEENFIFSKKISSIYTNYPQNMQKTCKKHWVFSIFEVFGVDLPTSPKVACFLHIFEENFIFSKKISSIYTNYPQNMQKTCKKHWVFSIFEAFGVDLPTTPKVACFLHVFCMFSRKIAFSQKKLAAFTQTIPKTCKKHAKNIGFFQFLRCLGLIFQPPPKFLFFACFLHIFEEDCIFSKKISSIYTNYPQNMQKTCKKHWVFSIFEVFGVDLPTSPKVACFLHVFCIFSRKIAFCSIYTNYPQNMQKTCKKHAKNIGFFQFLRCLGLIFQPPPKLHVFCMCFACFLHVRDITRFYT